ncbi:MAG: ABC transporter ATP-binding protein [Erysipelotrichaceae bacterium]|nr:ABC transporter ATP-binding protein [Erysipelotrichaceae bacterium]
MKNKIKELFALTDNGVNDLIKSCWASFVVYFVNLLPSILLMLVLNELILKKINDPVIYYLFCAGIIVVMAVALFIEYNVMYNATYKEAANLRIELANKLSRLPLSYFSKHDLTDLSQTIMSDINAIEHAMGHAIGKTVGFIMFFPIIAIMLLMGNYKLGLTVIITNLSVFVFLAISKKIQLRENLKYYQRLRDNSDSFQEAIELQQEIKSYNLKKQIGETLNGKMGDSEKIHIRAEFTAGLLILLSGLSLQLTFPIVVAIGTSLLINGEINILYLIGYILISIKIKDAIEAISLNIAELYYIDSMVNRIKEIQQTKTQKGMAIELNNYDIELEHVSFGYSEDTKVLKDISFVAKQNEVTALVGASGCGKTSILRLVSRLYDYDSGSIKIDGKDIKNISTDSLFEKISIVFQDVILFNASIMENIRIGNKNASDEEVIEAAKLANCDDFINNLSDGYHTVIGENGATLSGGERQRLSIARAFLKNAPIIILDEISASLDVENEKKIQESLNLLIKNKTVLIISHRLKSIENASKIVVLNDGIVEAVGSHKELLNSSKTYKKLIDNSRLVEEFTY